MTGQTTTIHTLADIDAGTRLCLFGAGDYGRSFHDLVHSSRRDLEIVCFADSFKTGSLFGKPIVTPDQLVQMAADIHLIIITSIAYQDNIADTLRALGLPHAFMSPIIAASTHSADTSAFDQILYAFYDRAVAPEGFDIVHFLYLAESARMKSGTSQLHVVIVPPPKDSFVKRRLGKMIETNGKIEAGIRETEATKWWERHILQPCCWMIASCAGVSVCGSREEAALYYNSARHIYPHAYTVDQPCEGHSLKKLIQGVNDEDERPRFQAPAMANDFVSGWLNNHCGRKKPVVITLRQSPFQPQRNSNETAWIQFAHFLPKSEYVPIFMRDTSVALTPPPEEMREFLIFNEGCWNMELRMALYELSFLNLFISSGPAAFANLNQNTRNLVFMVLSDFSFETSMAHIECGGLTTSDAKYPGGTRHQKLIWQEDTYDNIVREFRAFTASFMGP